MPTTMAIGPLRVPILDIIGHHRASDTQARRHRMAELILKPGRTSQTDSTVFWAYEPKAGHRHAVGIGKMPDQG